ncbi:MAG: dTDP-4-dehydrorhamnose 3,5-epimerase [Ardenticatenia bacterium]|jgi:dTDP-4-dehydrorhamnose 3,5-epimerase|nr:MAG: dTDP-4-dehydrorhamnose 3,5-epimerase [Ardenticatenia bacterium]
MVEIVESPHIRGVRFVHLHTFSDARGMFIETFRKEWFPDQSWEVVQTNCSHSRAGVLRGLHYHLYQTDYWYVVQGTIRAGLVDLRRSSPTYRATQIVDLSGHIHTGLLLPRGVAHGFLALSDVILTYLVNRYYDASDEYGLAWNDPELCLDWGLQDKEPLVSARDRTNPLFAQIPTQSLPD